MWLRWVAVFCMALIGVASTAQVCHTHDEGLRTAVRKVSGQAAADVEKSGVPEDRDSKTDSSVRCPLCIAMHAVLPVANELPQVELLESAREPVAFERVDRLFSWRFEMASRPPPVQRFLA